MTNDIDPIKFESAVEQYNLTQKEQQFLTWLLEKGLFAELGFSDVSTQDVADELDWSVKSVKGVYGSLAKKGFCTSEEYDGNGDIQYFIHGTKLSYCLRNDEWVEENWNELDNWY